MAGATAAAAATLTPVVDPPAGSDLQVRPEENQSSCQHFTASAQVARPGRDRLVAVTCETHRRVTQGSGFTMTQNFPSIYSDLAA